MKNWFGYQIKLASEEVESKIKQVLKTNKFTLELMRYYNIPVEDIDSHLNIEIRDLDGKFAEGNSNTIFLDTKLFEGDFFKDNFHFVIHEFLHWLKRRAEKEFYFNDPEEVQSFVLAMTWELLQGKSENDLIKTFYPIIESHFSEKSEAQETFSDMVEKAKELSVMSQN